MVNLGLQLLSLVTVLVAGDKVCYAPYGCFSDDPPFDQALLQLPNSPSHIRTQFLYYTRRFREVPLNPLDPKSPSKAKFNPTKTTVMLIHGYLESRLVWYVKMFIDELLQYEDMNVIFCEWSRGAVYPYQQASGNVRLVGAQITRMIEILRSDTGINMSKLRLIGFSLGAHAASFAGRNLRRKGIILPRITGLDPAAPYYENEPIDARLDPTDAEFVDVIHTDSKTVFIHGFGTVQAMGHIDFYPNGGFHQIGCTTKLDIGVVSYIACSHFRAIRYYMESILNPCPFYGYPCKSYEDYQNALCTQCPDEGCPRMGFHAQKPKKPLIGMKYYLQTKAEFPYCGYHYKFGFHTGSKYFADLHGSVTVTLEGEKGNTTLDLPYHYYDSGSTERMIAVTRKEIGVLKKVKVVHNRVADVWYLIAVSVKPMWTNTEYSGCFNRWLNNINSKVDLYEASPDTCSG